METQSRFRLAVVIFANMASATSAATSPEPTERDRLEAREYERLGDWGRASEAYLRLLGEDRNQPEVRERLALCLRHIHQARRHSDPVYRSYIAALPVSHAVGLYSETLTTIHQNYVSSFHATINKLFRHGLDEFRFALADPTFLREHLGSASPAGIAQLRMRIEGVWSAKSVDDVRDARQLVRDIAWDAQTQTGLNPSVVVLEFACGACQALDEYTLLITPGRPVLDAGSLNADLAAFGLAVTALENGYAVERVVPGSWAAGVGLMRGDQITRVGKTPLDRLSLEAILELVRGERSTVSELTAANSGSSETRTLALPESVPSVLDAAIERDGVGYIRLAHFQKTTPQEFDSALLRLRSEGLRALVLDLRGNPGGSFPAAVQVAERLLGQGVIVSTQSQLPGMTKTFLARNAAMFEGPVVVLIDGDTASAAEVLAGALRDQQRAILVGQRTFGKDTIQRLMHLSEGGAIRLTLARFLLPGGKPFAGAGVEPTIFESRRDPMRDYQLESALEQASRLLAMR
jgi:C-terminal peptidase prc